MLSSGQLPAAQESRTYLPDRLLAVWFIWVFLSSYVWFFPKEERERLEASLLLGQGGSWAGAYPHCPRSLALHAAAWAAGEPSDATHRSAHWSSRSQCLLVRAGHPPCHLPDPTACQPPACPLWLCAGSNQRKPTAGEQTSERGGGSISAPLFQATQLPSRSRQLASDGATPLSPGNGHQVGAITGGHVQTYPSIPSPPTPVLLMLHIFNNYQGL